MIRVDFIVDDDARVTAIRFSTDGLTGYEKTDTIKSALEAMAIENPTSSNIEISPKSSPIPIASDLSIFR